MILKRYRCSPTAVQPIDKVSRMHANQCSRAHLSSRSRICMAMGLLLIMLGLCHPSQAQQDFTYNPNHYDTAKIIQAMKTPHSDLRIVSAHRGLHAKFGDDPTVQGVPENSIGALEAGATAGLELMEFDIKLTSDGIPICSHDLTWGRETNPEEAGSNVFDPFSSPSTPIQISLNPRVDSLTAAETQAQYNLRDSVSFLPNYGSSQLYPPTLKNVIDRINLDQISAVLALDVKDATSFQAAWLVVKANQDWLGNAFSTHVVWKVNGGIYQTPAAFKAAFGEANPNGGLDYQAINFWPNYNTAQIGAVTSTAQTNFGSEEAMIDSLNQFWAHSELSLIAPEITEKQQGGILDQMRQANINAGHTVAEFAAYKDYVYPNDSTQTAQFFWTGGTDPDTGAQLGGSCCVDLAHYYFNNPVTDESRPSDTADNRGDFNFVVGEGFNVITTDDVLNWANQLAGLNLRNLSYMQQTGYGTDPHCNVGTGQYPGCDANGTTVFTYCVAEGGTCSFTGVRTVYFGANGLYNSQTVTNSASCSLSAFPPDDPAPGIVKGCYYGPAIGPGASVYCADENGTCSFQGGSQGAGTVYFGAGGRPFATYANATNSLSCSLTPFPSGYPDPAPNVVKTCFYQLYSGGLYSGPAGYILCANQGQTCNFVGAARIAFGANGNFSYRTFAVSSPESSAGGAPCNGSEFIDPNIGAVEACYYQVVVAGSATSSGGGSGTGTSTGSGNSGSGVGSGIAQRVADPAYFYPGTLWTELDTATPSVGIAVANVSNGPDYISNSDYVTAIQQASWAGIKVLGYVDTGYFGGTSPARTTRLGQTDVNSWIAQIEEDVNTWYSLYGSDGLAGIFFDDGQNVCGTNNQYVTLYTDIQNYVKQNHPGAYVVMNPGTPVPQCFQYTADTLLTFENAYPCYINDPADCPGWIDPSLTWNPVDPQKIWHSIYNVPATEVDSVAALSKARGAGFVFTTSATLAENPYGSLPAYFAQEDTDTAAGGATANVALTTPPTPSVVTASPTTVTFGWSASTEQNGGGVVAYDIVQDGKKIVSVPAATSPQATITGLTPSTAYSFAITARDAAGNVSPSSSPLLYETNASDGTAVTAPALSATQQNYTDVQLTWSASVDANYAIAYYDVFENGKKTLTVDGTETNVDVGGLTPGSTYSFTVQARDTNGNVSPMSNTGSFSTLSYPSGGAITNVTYGLTASSITFSATYLSPFGFHHIFFDFDATASTGYQFGWTSPALGADYLIENDQLNIYTGDGSSWSWSPVLAVTPVITGSPATGITYTWTVPFSVLPGAVTESRFMAHGTGYAPEAYGTVIQTSIAIQ